MGNGQLVQADVPVAQAPQKLATGSDLRVERCGKVFCPQIYSSDKIERFRFVNVEPARMCQRDEGGRSIALLRFQFSEGEESRILPPVIIGEFLNHRQSGFWSADATKSFRLQRHNDSQPRA